MISSKITSAISDLFCKKKSKFDKTPFVDERPTVVIGNKAVPISQLKKQKTKSGILRNTKTLVLLSILLPTSLFSQRALVKIKSSIFYIEYSEVYQQPLFVRYNVNCNGTEKQKFSRAGLDFFKCDTVITSDAKDYEKNVYDKGHMAPAAAFSCNQADLKATFSYLNCALQDQYLNRGAWRLLEEHERELMLKNGPIYVEIELVFTKNSKTLPTGARVPDGFYKKIWKSGPKPMVLESYYFPNEKPKSSDYKIYRISK